MCQFICMSPTSSALIFKCLESLSAISLCGLECRSDRLSGPIVVQPAEDQQECKKEVRIMARSGMGMSPVLGSCREMTVVWYCSQWQWYFSNSKTSYALLRSEYDLIVSTVQGALEQSKSWSHRVQHHFLCETERGAIVLIPEMLDFK